MSDRLVSLVTESVLTSYAETPPALRDDLVALVSAYAPRAASAARVNVSDVIAYASVLGCANLDAGHDATESARLAVLRVCDRLKESDLDRSQTATHNTDNGAPLDAIARSATPNGESHYRTTVTDTLAEVLRCARPYLTERQAEIMREIGWTDTYRRDVVPYGRIAANLGETVTGRRAQAFAREVDATLAIVRDVAGNVVTHRDHGHVVTTLAPLAHFTRKLGERPTLNTQGEQLTYRPNGTSTNDAWHTFPGKSGDRREVTRVMIGGEGNGAILTTARRPAGVGAGMVYGPGHIAGGGTPELRPVTSRKAGRVGSTGPTVPLSH